MARKGFSDKVWDKLHRIPRQPNDEYEAGWARVVHTPEGDEVKTYPSYKERLETATPGEHYDIYLDAIVGGKERTFHIAYTTLGDFARRSRSILDKALADISEALDESEPGLSEDLEVKYYWRAKKSEEQLRKGAR